MDITEKDKFLLKYKAVVNLLLNGTKNKDIHLLYHISDKTLSKLRKHLNL